MNFENPRPSQKTEGPPATGTRDRVPMLVDLRHDHQEGVQLHHGMVNYDYTKCTQRLDRAHISNRWKCYHLVVAAPPGDVEIEEVNPPPPPPRTKHARRQVEIWSRHTESKPPSKDGPTPATKTSITSLPRTNVPKAREDCLGEHNHLEMLLQREQSKTIVKDQSLERRHVTEDHPSKWSHGKKTSPPT